MLAPTTTQNDVQQAINAVQSVTNYAQASVTAIPDIPGTQGWQVAIQQDIETAQNHGQNWINNICPAASSGIPSSIVSFNNSFQTIAAQLASILGEIGNQNGGIPTAQQRSAVDSQFDQLAAAAGTVQQSVKGLSDQVAQYTSDTNSDQKTLGNDVNTAVAQISNGASQVAQISGAIGENFLDMQQLGPCSVIVNIDMNIQMKVTETGADQGLIAAIYTKIILESIISDVQMAQKSVQDIHDAWVILQGKIAAVQSDLKDASNDQYQAQFEQLDIQTAASQWQQLAAFAQTLIS